MIFLSYSWSDNKITEQVDGFLQSSTIKITRDIRDLNYKQSIKEYMSTIRDSDFVILLITENYLKSANCMFECLEFIKETNYKDRIIPIIKQTADIFSPEGKLRYLEYWENKIDELEAKIKTFNATDMIPIIQEIKHYKNIKTTIIEFLDIIGSYNNIVIDDEFQEKNYRIIYEYIFPENRNPIDAIEHLWLETFGPVDKFELSFIYRLICSIFIKPPFEINYDTVPIYSYIEGYIFWFPTSVRYLSKGFDTFQDIEKGVTLGLLNQTKKVITNGSDHFFKPNDNLIVYKSKKLVAIDFLQNVTLEVYTVTERALKILSLLWNNKNYQSDFTPIENLIENLAQKANIKIMNYEVIDENGSRFIRAV